jgi:hypothetical protein
MTKTRNLFAAAAITLAIANAFGAVSADEAKKLGTILTPFGAEVAGNADKSIPEYSGGVAAPADYKKGSGMRPDPFAADRPLYTIKAADAAKYDARLTAGTKELLKKYPTMRVDVYPTRRSMGYPKYVLENTLKNAVSAKAVDGGLGLEGTQAGIPFPIPTTANEVMWNHILRFQGPTQLLKYDSINVDASGKAVLATTGEICIDYPYYDANRAGISSDGDVFFRTKITYTAPARRAGEALLVQDYVNPMKHSRKAWQYLPGQRRVKLAPDIAYDTPNPGTAGTATYDDAWLFNGAMDRYEWKLLGKREMIVPYNAFKLAYATDTAPMTTPGHLNPDFVRWELHRVWVVEATLKEGKRHIYAKRTFYVDEDSWTAVASDEYDAHGGLFRAGFIFSYPAYDIPAPSTNPQAIYDFVSGGYNVQGLYGAHGVGQKFIEPLPATQWSSDALAAAGVR